MTAVSLLSPSGPQSPPAPADGLLVVDKPAGPTSHDVLERVRRRLRLPGAGHLGTLDPGATGLLLVLAGAAARCAPVWQGGDKTYEGGVRFGIVTSTQDVHGEVLERRDSRIDPARVREASRAFVGEIEQRPPMVSAVRVRGERLYDLARRGVTVERRSRRVTVRSWDWLELDDQHARFRVVCSSGTYVRTLVHDLGERLGSGAALDGLRRLRSEPFGLERSVTAQEIETLTPAEVWARGGIPLDDALAHLPTLTLDAAEEREIGFGARPRLESVRAEGLPVNAGPRSIVLRAEGGRALGLGEIVPLADGTDRLLACPHVVFPWATRHGRPQGDDPGRAS